jgi:hypothetical protein
MASDFASSSTSIGDHGYREQIEAAVSELLMLERDASWSYHSVKQNVLISQSNSAPVSSNGPFAYGYGYHLADSGVKEFQKVRGQGIVHAPPETAFNCISDLDMLSLWDGFSSEQQLIAEYSLGDQGLIRILYIRFNGIFPVSSRDICVCTIKRAIMPRKASKKQFKHSTSPIGRPGSPANDSGDPESFVLTAFSVDHPSCPPSPGFVRAELRASGFIIRPYANSSCSSVTYILQFHAKGWLPTALASMVSEYQPLRIAKIRDIARTYQNSQAGPSKGDFSSNVTSSTRFGWMQQCRGELKEEEEFIAAERQRLEEASVEMLKLRFKPHRFSASSTALVAKSKPSTLNTPTKRHHRSASSGSSKAQEASSSSTRSGSVSSDTLRSFGRRHENLHHSEGHIPNEGEGGETDLTESRPARLRPPRLTYEQDIAASGDSDSEQGDYEQDSDDSSPFYDATSDLQVSALLEPGSDGHFVVLKMLNNDVELIRCMQAASQIKLEAIEENLKNRSMQNTRLLDHLDGLKSFLLACMDKLRGFSAEHKAMEDMRLRLEQKWQSKLTSIAQKLNNAQRGYWTPRRARQALLSRFSTFIFILIVWPVIFIKLYKFLQKPQKYLKRLFSFARLVLDWLFPNIPFNSDV